MTARPQGSSHLSVEGQQAWLGHEVSSGQETSHEHPSGMSHPSRGLRCWELCKGSPWEHHFPSLLGEMPTSQPVLGGRLFNRPLEVPPHQHFCALTLTEHTELETQMGKGSWSPKTAIPSHLSNSSTSPPMTGARSGVSWLPQGQTTHFVHRSWRSKRSLRTGCLPRKVPDKTGKAAARARSPSIKPSSLWKLDGAHHFSRERSCLRSYVTSPGVQ